MVDLADEIRRAPHAGKAKGLSKRIPSEFRDNWEKMNTDKMKELITAKAAQVPEFEYALLESSDYVLAEATPDKFWASGLSSDITSKTQPSSWPGLNTLGKLLMEVRDSIILNLSNADNEAEDDSPHIENSAPDSLFQDDFPALTSVTGKPSAETESVSMTSLSDTKETSATSAAPSLSNSNKPPKQTQKTLAEACKTKDSATRKSKSEKRKPSKTPEKEKLNKLKRLIQKK